MKAKTSRPKRQTEREFMELQRLMAGAVMNPLAADGGMQTKWHDGRPMKKVVAEFIKPNNRLTSFERLEIYNRQYWYRIKDCFYDDYPGLRGIVGETRFDRLAEAYIARHPSHSFTLRNLGQDLLDFLEREPKWIAPLQKPALDMARLEWAHVEAFDNETRPTLEIDSLLGANPDKIYLRLQPHVTLLHLNYELDVFLIQLKQGERLREDASNAMEQNGARKQNKPKKKLRSKPIFLAVHRHHDAVYYKRLEPGQFCLLTAFRAGASLTQACEKLAETFPADLVKIQSWFESWAALGWFCKLG